MHQRAVHLHDNVTLRAALERAGFVDVTPFAVSDSDTRDLRGIEGSEALIL